MTAPMHVYKPANVDGDLSFRLKIDGIDEFSHLAVFLAAATNNISTTMTEAFMSGTQSYGVTSRVRSDKGLENTGVGAFMIAHKDPGRSVLNQRIERLWRDLYQGCTNVFHILFPHMEVTGELDLESDMQMWCLQFVYLPRIQRALNHFRAAWNVHSVSSEGGRTQTQIDIQGMVQQAGLVHRGVDDMVFEPLNSDVEIPKEEYGFDENGPEPCAEGPSSWISNIPTPVAPNVVQQLRTEVYPLEGDDLYIEPYRRAVLFGNQQILIIMIKLELSRFC